LVRESVAIIGEPDGKSCDSGWLGFEKEKPQKKARRDYTIKSYPPHSRTSPDYKNCCTIFARAKVDIVLETTREVLANGSLLQPTIQNVGGRQQLHRPLYQCGQSVDVELFLKLHADVHHRLVTEM
jgi:hypothetical protein